MHESLLSTVWPAVGAALLSSAVTLKCCPTTLATLHAHAATSSHPQLSMLAMAAVPEDYDTEFLENTLAVLVVPSLAAAMAHINDHSSHHTDSIVTEDEENGKAFCRGIDSAGVFINASTRFADGFRYGFGTEVGVSTGKTHARGPVGLEGVRLISISGLVQKFRLTVNCTQLVIYKYQIRSSGPEGHTTAEFSTEGKQYLHTPLSKDLAPF